MRRTEFPEIHDHPLFPGFLRDHVTAVLEALWNTTGAYRCILPQLRDALQRCGSDRVLDLCSGGGGPWLRLSRELRDQYRFAVDICLSDRYPNEQAFAQARAASSGCIHFHHRPVDAASVPRDLQGFRTIFSSFHHFAPSHARAILRDSVCCRQGIGIFEVAQRRGMTFLMVCALPFLVLAMVPAIRPFRWSRLFWTYLVPVIPFVLWFDGLVSCMRTYSLAELNELAQSASTVADHYQWKTGSAGIGRLRVTYLIGYPLSPRHAAESAGDLHDVAMTVAE